jgi:hypothetical protein
LLSPLLHEVEKGGVPKLITHRKKGIDVLDRIIEVYSPISKRVQLDVLSRNGIEPEKDQCL